MYRKRLSKCSGLFGIGRALVVAAGLAALAPVTAAEKKQGGLEEDPERIKGKLVSLERKGRSLVLTMTDKDGEEKEFMLTSRVSLLISAKGDNGFLAPKQFVSTTAVMSNKMLFAKQLNVLVSKGKTPRAGLAKAPPKAGQSMNAYLVAGEILSRQNSKEYEDYETVTVNVGGRNGTSVFLDKGYTVTVSVTDPEFAKPEADVELQGQTARGRFNVTAVKIKLKGELKSEDLLAPPAKKGRKKR